MLTQKITARLFGAARLSGRARLLGCAFLFSMLLCHSNTLLAQDSLLLRDYRYLRQSSPWLTQRNAAALSLFDSRNIAEADLSLSHASGSLTGFSGSPSLTTLQVAIESFYRISPRAVVFGAISYDNLAGDDMTGSVFLQDRLPFDIVEDSLTNLGRKQRDTYHLTGSFASNLYKGISDSYKSLKDYPNAIESYQSYLNAKEDADATDQAGLGLLQNSYARSLEGEARAEAFAKADKMWEELAVKFPDAEEYALWQRGRLMAQQDTDLTGLAKANFERLIELVTAHEEVDATDKTRLFDAYSYLMRYNVKQKNNKAAYENSKKLLELQPDDAEIQKVVEALEKAAN